MYNGIINVYKEKGFTSFDVVAKLRGILHQKKIGHTGTLDPDAEGVLPVCLGRATKVCGMLADRDKEYEAVLLLGKETDTQDLTGTVLHEAEANVSEKEVRNAIAGFVGEYEQIPPMYSALKVNGQKLCDLARKGITVERQARKVHIYELEVLSAELPRVRMRVRCSKGTYIRTLCQDIGRRLGCFGCMESLVRTRVADFTLENSLRLSEIEALLEKTPAPMEAAAQQEFPEKTNVNKIIIKVDKLFLQYPSVFSDERADKLVANGNRIPEEFIRERENAGSQVRLYDSKGSFIGLYAYQDADKDYKPIKIFME